MTGLEEWEASLCCDPCPHHNATHKCDKPKGHDDYHEVWFDHVFMERWAQKPVEVAS